MFAGPLCCEVEDLHHAKSPHRRKGAGTKKQRRQAMEQRPVPLAPAPQVDIEASAGPGAFGDEFVAERARWLLPEGTIRYERNASLLLQVCAESMEPELSEDYRLLVDTARRVPETDEIFVPQHGSGLVVKQLVDHHMWVHVT